MIGPDVAVTDGRLLRGVRTRAAIVEALLDLLNDGVASPTAAQIATRAGVSVRSVFQHFEDLEALYADLALEQSRRVAPLLESLERTGSLADRIDALVRQRSRLYRTIRPVRHAIGTRAQASPALQRRLEELSAQLRTQVETQFADELAVDASAAALLDSIDALCSFETWDRMVGFQAMHHDEVDAALRVALGRLLDVSASR